MDVSRTSSGRITQEDDHMEVGVSSICVSHLQHSRMNVVIEGDLWGHAAPEPVGSKGIPANSLGLRSAGEWVTSPVESGAAFIINFKFLLLFLESLIFHSSLNALMINVKFRITFERYENL